MLVNCIIALSLLVATVSSLASASSNDRNTCGQYSALYANIDRDLEPWKANGISQELMERTIHRHTSYRRAPHSQKGFAAGFIRGTAVLLTPPEMSSWTGHHAAIWIVYMKVLLHLEETFGRQIPDVVRRVMSGGTRGIPN